MQRVEMFVEQVIDLADRHRVVSLALCSVVYLFVVGRIAVVRPLENDELFTLYVSRLPSLSAVWGALMAGGEQLPPFFFVLTRASLSLGGGNLSLRLPELIGVWVMSLCLFRFVGRRAGFLSGLTAAWWPQVTFAVYYGSNARPYGLVVGFTGLALVAWQSAVDPHEPRQSRGWALAGLTLSLAAAISCHYYAVLVLFPFACGEVMRTITRRRVDGAVWLALGASLGPLAIFYPLVAQARRSSTGFWATPRWADMLGMFHFLLETALTPLVLILLIGAVAAALDIASRAGGREGLTRPHLPLHECATAIGFVLLPAVAVTFAMWITGGYTHRYALASVIGFAVLVPFVVHAPLRGRRALSGLVVGLLMLGFIRQGSTSFRDSQRRAEQLAEALTLLGSPADAHLPIVCASQHDFFIFSEYAPPATRERLVYLADPDISMRVFGHSSLERGMLDLLKPWFKLNVLPYQPFAASGRSFLLYGDPDFFINWILPDLMASGRRLELRGRTSQGLLFLVNPTTPPQGESRAR